MKRINAETSAAPWSIETTLLDLVVAVQDVSKTDDEVVSVITRMMDTGRVVLRGIFAGTPLGPRATAKREESI
jgi:hypothetical protein